MFTKNQYMYIRPTLNFSTGPQKADAGQKY